MLIELMCTHHTGLHKIKMEMLAELGFACYSKHAFVKRVCMHMLVHMLVPVELTCVLVDLYVLVKLHAVVVKLQVLVDLHVLVQLHILVE